MKIRYKCCKVCYFLYYESYIIKYFEYVHNTFDIKKFAFSFQKDFISSNVKLLLLCIVYSDSI